MASNDFNGFGVPCLFRILDDEKTAPFIVNMKVDKRDLIVYN
jgi:hypothetical protein